MKFLDEKITVAVGGWTTITTGLHPYRVTNWAGNTVFVGNIFVANGTYSATIDITDIAANMKWIPTSIPASVPSLAGLSMFDKFTVTITMGSTNYTGTSDVVAMIYRYPNRKFAMENVPLFDFTEGNAHTPIQLLQGASATGQYPKLTPRYPWKDTNTYRVLSVFESSDTTSTTYNFSTQGGYSGYSANRTMTRPSTVVGIKLHDIVDGSSLTRSNNEQLRSVVETVEEPTRAAASTSINIPIATSYPSPTSSDPYTWVLSNIDNGNATNFCYDLRVHCDTGHVWDYPLETITFERSDWFDISATGSLVLSGSIDLDNKVYNLLNRTNNVGAPHYLELAVLRKDHSHGSYTEWTVSLDLRPLSSTVKGKKMEVSFYIDAQNPTSSKKTFTISLNYLRAVDPENYTLMVENTNLVGNNTEYPYWKWYSGDISGGTWHHQTAFIEVWGYQNGVLTALYSDLASYTWNNGSGPAFQLGAELSITAAVYNNLATHGCYPTLRVSTFNSSNEKIRDDVRISLNVGTLPAGASGKTLQMLFNCTRTTPYGGNFAAELKNLYIIPYPVDPDPTIHVSSVTLNKHNETIYVGGHVNLEATVLPNNADDKRLHWSSSNTQIATAPNTSGTIGVSTGRNVGTATITATSWENSQKSASCIINVIDRPATYLEGGAGNRVAVFDIDCIADYYLQWQDRYGSFQSQPFDKVATFSEDISQTNITNYSNEQRPYNIVVTPKWKIQSDWIDEDVYPFYESIFVSPTLTLYDTKEDVAYSVLINSKYTEKTFKNQHAFFNLSLDLTLNKNQNIIY